MKTDKKIEEIKKEFEKMLDKALGYYESDGSNITDEGTRKMIWNFFESYLKDSKKGKGK